MALIQINKDPSARDLKWFGALFGAFFGLAGALVWWRSGSLRFATLLWALAVVVPAAYYALPPLRRPMFLGWTYLAFPIGLIVSYLVLAAVYFLVFAPMGLVMRALGYDPLKRAFDPRTASYWIDHRTGSDPSRYFNQY